MSGNTLTTFTLKSASEASEGMITNAKIDELILHGQLEPALAALAAHPERHHDAKTNLQYSYVLQKLDRFEDAEIIARLGVKGHSTNYRLLCRLSDILAKLDRLPEAIGLALEATRHHPSVAHCYIHLSGLYVEQKNWQAANDALETALTFDADHEGAAHLMQIIGKQFPADHHVNKKERIPVRLSNNVTSFRHDGLNFRTPCDLTVTNVCIRRILLVGQCLLDAWAFHLNENAPEVQIERILFNLLTTLPDEPPAPANQYDFAIVALPLRSIVNERDYLELPYSDAGRTAQIFREACERLSLVLKTAMVWNKKHGLLSFVTNFFVPQANPDGRLLPRNDLRNMVYFVERLNDHLASELQHYSNANLLDIDQISSSIGRRYV